MPQPVILMLLVAFAVTAADCYVVSVWWRAMIRDTRWIALFPLAVPIILFGPMFVFSRAAAALAIDSTIRNVLLLLCLGAVAVTSLRCALRYHYMRRDHAHPNV
jgi:hypothetical protein